MVDDRPVEVGADVLLGHLGEGRFLALAVWRDAQIQGKLIDDRPPRSKEGWLKATGAVVQMMLETLKQEPPWTQERVDAGAS